MHIPTSCRVWPASRRVWLSSAAALLLAPFAAAQPLSVHWEELTASDFVRAIHQAKGVCLLPFGILEKHGPHLPIGTDLLDVRYAALHAAAAAYAVVFPEYYFGQIFEARQEPGTIAYSARLQLELLQVTIEEMARNGCTKIVIVNGHGGNNSLLPYFAQTQLDSPRDYVVYVHGLPDRTAHRRQDRFSRRPVGNLDDDDLPPDLVHQDRAAEESGADQHHLSLPDGLYTAIWWYAKFPDHYGGDGTLASKELGQREMTAWIDGIVKTIQPVKADDATPRLQREFFEKTTHPLDTKQGDYVLHTEMAR